jgi:restriction system protein
MAKDKIARSKQSAAKTIHTTFMILKEANGQMLGREIVEKLRQSINFTPWELEVSEKTGYIRWEVIHSFYSIDCVKAGFLRKHKGIWYLTEDGEKATNLGEIELLNTVSKAYREWESGNRQEQNGVGKKEKETTNEDEDELPIDQEQRQKATLDSLEEQAIGGIKEFINKKNPYLFQDLVAALLRAMGYFTPFISPKGRDGGIDIIAYSDPLGAIAPRLKVQVKHKPTTAIPVDDIRNLKALVSPRNGEIGIFVTSGTYTSESRRFARETDAHIRLIDIAELIELWQEFYPKLSDEEKNLLPLHPIYFLGTNE